MGMFDDVRCRYPLPDPAHNGLNFQTKDTPSQSLDTYLISAEGRLFRREWVEVDFHGDLRFYAFADRHDTNSEWIEYVALFTDGQLTRVERVAPDQPLPPLQAEVSA